MRPFLCPSLPSMRMELPRRIHRASSAGPSFCTGSPKTTPFRHSIGAHTIVWLCPLDQVSLALLFPVHSLLLKKSRYVDVFVLMDKRPFFQTDRRSVSPVLPNAQCPFWPVVLWIRRLATLDGEEKPIEDWQVKRDGGQRGIVEIIGEST